MAVEGTVGNAVVTTVTVVAGVPCGVTCGVACPVGTGMGTDGTGRGMEGTGVGMYPVGVVGGIVGGIIGGVLVPAPGLAVPITEGVAFTPLPGPGPRVWQLGNHVLATILETCPRLAKL